MKSFFSNALVSLLIAPFIAQILVAATSRGEEVILIEATTENWALQAVRRELLERHNIPAAFLRVSITPQVCAKKNTVPLHICISENGDLAFKSRNNRKLMPLKAFKRIKSEKTATQQSE